MARSLREGLGKVVDVVDIWCGPGGHATACDAVITVDCVSLVPEPYFIYLCPEQGNEVLADLVVYERAIGLFTVSGRMARWLADDVGIPREKIHVIPPAVAARQYSPFIHPRHLDEAPRRKLLLCVSDCKGQSVNPGFMRIVLDMLAILRREHDPRICLTISGLENCLGADLPLDGVTFRSAPPAGRRMALFDTHDLLVLPPGLGADGLPEALSWGIPCVAARASEMSEAIIPGVTGSVIDEGTAAELALVIASVLANDDIYRSCYERAPAMAAYFSWERVARQLTHVISREVGFTSAPYGVGDTTFTRRP